MISTYEEIIWDMFVNYMDHHDEWLNLKDKAFLTATTEGVKHQIDRGFELHPHLPLIRINVIIYLNTGGITVKAYALDLKKHFGQPRKY